MNELARRPEVDDNVLDLLRSSKQGVPYLNLAQGQTGEVGMTSIRAGEFFLSNKDKLKSVPCGTWESVGGKRRCALDMVYLNWRPKAVLFVENQPQFQSYDPNSETFQKIINTQPVKQGQGPKTITPDFGMEVLVYIPNEMLRIDDMLNDEMRMLSKDEINPIITQYANGTPAAFFFKGANRQFTFGGPVDRGGLEPGSAITLRSELIKGSNFNWWQTPIRGTIEDQDQEWIRYARSLLDTDLVKGFPNEVAKTDIGESVDDDENNEAPIDR